MNEKKFKRIIACLGGIFLCLLLSIIFICLSLLSKLFYPDYAQLLVIVNGFFLVINIIIILCLLIMLLPLIELLEHLYQKNKED